MPAINFGSSRVTVGHARDQIPFPTSRPGTPSVGGRTGETSNHPTTHVEACMEMSRDAGSIPAASTDSDVTLPHASPVFLHW